MPQISTIKCSNIQEVKRYDAEYFKPEYLREDNLLKKKGFFILSDISDVKGGKRLPLGENFSNEGVPYIRAEDIKNGFVEYENVPKISEELHRKLINYQTKKDDVLLNIVGSVGGVGLINFVLKKCNLTENASKITNLREINPETIFVYLLSKYGQNQIHREKVGTVQEKLSLERIRKFKIPKYSNSFQLKIKEMIESAYQKQNQSKELYKEAEELLLKELDLLDYKPKNILSFETTASYIKEAKRFDSEYFQPEYLEVIKKIKGYKGGFDMVKNIVKLKKGIEVGTEAYTETGKDFIRVSDFSKFGIEESSKKISEGLFNKLKENFQPKKGDILFTKDGTIGITYVLKDDVDGVLSGAFLRLSLRKDFANFSKEYLCLFFNSILSKLQIKQLSGGALIAHLKPSDFEKIIIPLVDDKIQKEISEKIKESYELRKESKQLLEQAKKMVEEEIEK